MTYPTRVRVVEVGPRHGLQNEPAAVPFNVAKTLVECKCHCCPFTVPYRVRSTEPLNRQNGLLVV